MLLGALAVAGSLLAIVLHSLLLVGWLAEGDPNVLYVSLLLLAVGVLGLALKARANTRPLRERGVSYGGGHLASPVSMLTPADIAFFYGLLLLAGFFVSLVRYGFAAREILEVVASLYLILTVVLAVVYPLAYHPLADGAAEMAGLLGRLAEKAAISSCGYARFVGLIAKRRDGSLLLLSLGHFTEPFPNLILSVVASWLLRPGESELDEPVLVVKPAGPLHEYRSVLSLAEWHLPAKIADARRVGGGLEQGLGEYVVLEGTVDLPSPDKRGWRVRGPATVYAFRLARKIEKRVEGRPFGTEEFVEKRLPRILMISDSLA